MRNVTRITSLCTLVGLLTGCESRTMVDIKYNHGRIEIIEDTLLRHWMYPGGKGVLLDRTTTSYTPQLFPMGKAPQYGTILTNPQVLSRETIRGDYTAVGGKPCYVYREHRP